MKLRFLIIFAILMVFSTTTLAQGTCTDLVTRALEKVGDSCKDPISNTICYGNGLIFAQAQPDVLLTFAESGDTASIEDIASLTHSPLDENAQIWGVSLMSLRANIPDTLPGQVVQIIVFGNVAVAEIKQNAFQFNTGVGASTCAEAPDSGIMVRTPEGVAEVNLTINEVDITMGSTAFIEANVEDGMTISMLDGSALVTAEGTTYPVSFSQKLNVPLAQDDEGKFIPAGPPSPPQTWDAVKISKAFNIYNTLNQLGTSATVTSTETPEATIVITSPTPTLTFTPTITLTPAPTLTPVPCTIFAITDVITRVGPGYNRGSFVYLEPNKPIPVTGKKVVDEEIWWQLDKFEVSSSAASVLELWVAESLVTEQGACDLVNDVDAPPIIRISPTAAPQPTATLANITNPNLTPEIVPAVEPYINIEVEDRSLIAGECTTVYVDIEFVSAAYFNGPGSISDTTIEGPTWDVEVCPPSSLGKYTYTVEAYSLTRNLVKRSITINVIDD